MNNTGPLCNFCGKNKHQVKKLLAGNDGTHICDGCVDLCHDILVKEKAKDVPHKLTKSALQLTLTTPRALHEHLDTFVVGQESAKKTLSVAVYNHYKRVKNTTDVVLSKSNVLIAGPTGTGKTLMAQTLANHLQVPFVVTDATVITESGYAGDDSEVLIDKLLQAADYDIEKAQLGIIYVDEIDKKAKRNDMVSLSRDVSGEGVQQSLLKLMEGVIITVPNKTGELPERIDIDTTNILFIVGGAFVGLDDVVKQRIGKSKIGFQEDTQNLIENWEQHLQTKDLVKYGLIPEFVGRLPSINILQELTKEELVRILVEPTNCLIDQIKVLFSLDKIEIEFNNKALELIADTAIKQDLGARGLRKILDQALVETQYQLPELAKNGVTKIIITEQTIINGQLPMMIKG
jgi:ATP-dependent Clp protease ATP-binding subunit ClpX